MSMPSRRPRRVRPAAAGGTGRGGLLLLAVVGVVLVVVGLHLAAAPPAARAADIGAVPKAPPAAVSGTAGSPVPRPTGAAAAHRTRAAATHRTGVAAAHPPGAVAHPSGGRVGAPSGADGDTFRRARPAGPAPRPPAAAGALLPARVQLPGVRAAPVVPVGVVAGGLVLPADPGTVGWWFGGAVPGAARGTAVLAAHLDTRQQGAGPFAALLSLHVGDRVQVTDVGGGRRTFRVDARRSRPKQALPADVFHQDGTARLILLTCGGAFDTATGHYADNVIVYATPA